MKNGDDTVVYVGKAKNLRKRLASYSRTRDIKTAALIAEMSDVEWIVTDTEVEALILEAQLIQKYHPKYNIDLQSSGRYAFIKLTDEEYPRFVIARKITRDGKYFGQYPSAAARNATLKNLARIFRLCTSKTRGKACMRYHLGLCSGVCVRALSPEEYGQTIEHAEKFLKGDFASVIHELQKSMDEAVKNEEYEKAKIFRDQLLALQKLEEQNVSDPKRFNQDVVYYCAQESTMMVQLFHFNRGIISGRREFTFSLDDYLVSTPQEAFQEFLSRYYSGHAIPHEIVVQEELPEQKVLETYLAGLSARRVVLTVPKHGIKKKLLEMVKKNILESFGAGGGQLYELQQALHLQFLPRIIDCIDISHLGGTENVGSLVQFVNGEPRKSGYRKFKSKTVEGSNDFAMIEEVVGRFSARIREGKEVRPDLLMIDGGKGQLSSALRALAKHSLDIQTIGLAKRLEEIYTSWSHTPLHLHPKSKGLQVLRAIRDEAHRFAVSFQRKRRRIK
ncbi:excinuclease ABC subunit UvrC [Candidatus Uhrbacteria bacterium]|nr:excinuclease ABC subunit UvrC [Candidatus Uhrbacteria bacterium]